MFLTNILNHETLCFITKELPFIYKITNLMGILEHVDVLRYAWGIDLVALYIGGNVESVDGMDAATVVRKTNEGLLRGNICVKCLPVLQLLVQ